MIEPSDFGLFLREKRKAAHLTQDDLAVEKLEQFQFGELKKTEFTY